MTAQERFPKRLYEAQVVEVNPTDRYSFDNGGGIVFLLDNGQKVTWHIQGIINVKTDISLKTPGYFLNYPYVYDCKYFHRKLLNRYCTVHIELIINKNADEGFVPVIVGFGFSSKELFKYNGKLL